MDDVEAQTRKWLLTGPGFFKAKERPDVLKVAHASSGIKCDLVLFAHHLALAGFKPECREDRDAGGYYWVLALPERQPALKPPLGDSGRPRDSRSAHG